VKDYDALIIGGGIIGASLAFELCLKNQSVLLLDRREPGREASWAAAGTISPAPDTHSPAMTALCRESYRLYPALDAAIASATGKPSGFHPSGAIELFFGSRAESECDHRLRAISEAGVSARAISLSEARRLEPSLGPSARAALFISDEAYLDPRVLTALVLQAAEDAGAEIRSNAEALSLSISGSRCSGALVSPVEESDLAAPLRPVPSEKTEEIHARNTIVAAGWRSSKIAGVEPYAPTTPVRGQMVAFGKISAAPRMILRSENGYIAPREDGRVVAGSTLEPGLTEKFTTAAGLRKIFSAVAEMAPVLAEAPILESWAGLRPDSPDHLPVIGATDVEGLFIATGHYRNGMLLAPATAEFLSEWIVTGVAPAILQPFTPMRFASQTHSAHKL